MKHAISVLLSASVLVSAQVSSAQEDVARRYIEQGLDAAASGDTALALTEFEKARKAAPKMGDPYYYLGRIYTENANAIETDWRDRRKAEKLLLEALRIEPGDPRYLLELARLRLKQHMKVDAGRLFNRALEAAERQADPEVLAEVHFNLGYLKELWYRTIEYRRFNPLDMGAPHDQFIGTANPYGFMGAEGPTRYGNDYINQTSPIKGSGQITKDEMIEHYRAALRFDQMHVGASIRLMGHLVDELRLGEYMSIARRLRAKYPEQPLPYLYMGLGLHTAGREEAASEAFEEGLKRLPEEERKQVESLAEVMRRDDAREYMRMEDEERSEFHDRYWALSDPLYLTDANERRLEHLSRVAYADLRYAAPEAGLRGWQTDQGIIFVRYGHPLSIASFGASPYVTGNPYAVGQRSIIWSYGYDGPVFIFRQMPGYLNARFAGDYEFVAENYRYLQPAVYTNIPSIPELLEMPIQLARFRGETADEVALEVHAALPLKEFARDLDLDEGEIETGLFLIDAVGNKVVQRTNTEQLEYDESPDIDEYRSWRLILPPGKELIAAVEARDAVTWRSAAAREPFLLEAYPYDSLSVSDILVADYIKPLVEDPIERSDYEVWPNAALEYRSGDPVHVYYEIYGLEEDSEGFASYDVSIQVRVKSITRGGISAILGELADAWGFSIVGDDRLELQFSREVKMDGRDRVIEYLSLDPQEVPAGHYEIRLRIWDNLAERMGRRLRTFEVVNDEE